MVQANELRIGNLVMNLFGNPIIVTWENIKWAQDIFPVELTEEWLIKFGYSKEDRFWWNENSKVRISGNGIYYNNGSSLIRLNNYKYVHQLQNLYFALTGEELTIKETV